MIHFGFSYIGLLFLVLLFVPNIIWSKHKPFEYEKYVINENKILQTLERCGEILVCCIVLIFSDFNIKTINIWTVWLVLSFICMFLYECYWIRYFRSSKRMSDFYRGFCGIPLAGATLPVMAFFLLGIYGSNFLLIAAVVILGIGHIGIHADHYKEITKIKRTNGLFRKLIRAIAVTIVSAIFVFITVVIGCRNYNYITHACMSENGIEESTYISLGGQKQYVLIRGEDINNPVIIWIHGGPSSPDAMISNIFTNYLVDDYTVICWDQRGCGRTYFQNVKDDPQNETATFEQAEQDLNDLVEYACGRFGKDQVIIIGHSYGTLVGSKYALDHPETVAAYISVGQVVTFESDIYAYEDALAIAASKGDDTTAMTDAYERYQTDKSLENIMNLRSYTAPYHVAPKAANTLLFALTSPYLGVDDVRWFLKQLGAFSDYAALNHNLFDFLLETNVYDYGTEYRMPVGFIAGEYDWTTPVKYIEEYYHSISAPQKEIRLLEGCGHTPQEDSPEEFCEILKEMLNRDN